MFVWGRACRSLKIVAKVMILLAYQFRNSPWKWQFVKAGFWERIGRKVSLKTVFHQRWSGHWRQILMRTPMVEFRFIQWPDTGDTSQWFFHADLWTCSSLIWCRLTWSGSVQRPKLGMHSWKHCEVLSSVLKRWRRWNPMLRPVGCVIWSCVQEDL